MTDHRALRDAFGCFATGITIVTSFDEGLAPVGFTANSFTSVSLDPPLLLVSPAKNASSLPAIRKTGGYGALPNRVDAALLEACQQEILKANARLDEVHRLRKAGFSGTRIIALLGISASTLSRDMARLKAIGLDGYAA
jgi:hypothetical protein